MLQSLLYEQKTKLIKVFCSFNECERLYQTPVNYCKVREYVEIIVIKKWSLFIKME